MPLCLNLCTYICMYIRVSVCTGIYVHICICICRHICTLRSFRLAGLTTMAQLDPSPPLGPPFGMPPFLSLFNLAFCQHPSPFSKPISTLGVYALGSLLRGLYRERRFINLDIRYDTCVYTVPIAILASRRKTSFLLMLTVQCMNVLVYHKHRIAA